ncbi:MAG: hypothetical protein ACP5U2_17205 [Bryobacteraceae bacterium]
MSTAWGTAPFWWLARADRANRLDHWVVSRRAHVRVGLGDKWRRRFGVSTGFRAPVIFEEDLHVAAVAKVSCWKMRRG